MRYTKLIKVLPDILYVSILLLFALVYYLVLSTPEKINWYVIHIEVIEDLLRKAIGVL